MLRQWILCWYTSFMTRAEEHDAGMFDIETLDSVSDEHVHGFNADI